MYTIKNVSARNSMFIEINTKITLINTFIKHNKALIGLRIVETRKAKTNVQAGRIIEKVLCSTMSARLISSPKPYMTATDIMVIIKMLRINAISIMPSSSNG